MSEEKRRMIELLKKSAPILQKAKQKRDRCVGPVISDDAGEFVGSGFAKQEAIGTF